MSEGRIILKTKGMMCSSCEAKVVRSLSALDGVTSVRADHASGIVSVEAGAGAPDRTVFVRNIEKLGYSMAPEKDFSPLVGIAIGAVLSLLYVLADRSGVFSRIPELRTTAGLSVLFVTGLLTSIHCVAMCGGIALSQSLGAPSPADKSAVQAAPAGPEKVEPKRKAGASTLKPALLYNVGRLVSYTATGAIIGALGSAFDFSLRTKAMIMALAAVMMIVFGLRNLGFGIPKLFKFDLLKPFRGRLRTQTSGRGPLVVGLLNGFMPCGPLQSMQIFALGAGSALSGGLAMFAFGLGTIPLMLGLGAVAAFIPKRALPIAVRASGVLILVLGIATGLRAAALAGIDIESAIGFGAAEIQDSSGRTYQVAGASLIPFAATRPAKPSGESAAARQSTRAAVPGGSAIAVADKSLTPIKAVLGDGFQTITMPVSPGFYPTFIVQKDIPVHWIIRAGQGDLNGCNNAIIVPAFGIQQKLKTGDTIVNFLPKKSGVVPFSCWMGMIRSKFTVVDSLESVASGTVSK